MKRNINKMIGKVVRHFKGDFYLVLGVIIDSETGRKMVHYKALYEDYLEYARDLEMFMSEVDTDKYPNASQKYRFELVHINSVK